MKVLLVDDDYKRCDEIKRLLLNRTGILEDNLHICHNTQDAKKKLRNITFDFLILDVVLPKRDEVPDAKFGLNLLNDIKRRPTIKKPGKIVGITAQVQDIAEFRKKFDSHCEVIIEAAHHNKTWKSQITQAIHFEKVKSISKHTTKTEITCLTIHGIRTHGSWQQKLKNIIESNVDTVNFESYKYGYFSILSFMVPFLRNLKVSNFQLALKNLSKEEKELYIFCHSFGTHIVVNAINNLLDEGVTLKIKKLVLAGSVLHSSYDFSKILDSTDVKIVNDCGYQDKILLLSEGFVPNAGMAGRVGFYGLNNDRFVNRYFKGGHSHYFELESGFIEKYWLPLFAYEKNTDVFDERPNNAMKYGVIEKSFSLLGKIKEIFYIGVIGYFTYISDIPHLF